MIDRLSTAMTGIPIQPRTTADDGVRVNPINPINTDEKTDLTNQSDQSNPQQTDQKKKVEAIVKGINDFLQPSHTSLKFNFHEKLNQYYVTIVDDNTKEVIKEIPPKRLLDIYAAMAERLGFLVDRKI